MRRFVSYSLSMLLAVGACGDGSSNRENMGGEGGEEDEGGSGGGSTNRGGTGGSRTGGSGGSSSGGSGGTSTGGSGGGGGQGGGSGGAGGARDGGTADASGDGASVDGNAQTDGSAADGSSTDMAAASCGSMRHNVNGVGGEGIVIGRDGTLYFSVGQGVGRLKVGGQPQRPWARITGAGTVWGLTIDAENKFLFAGSPKMHNGTGKIHKVSLGDNPMVMDLVADAGDPNGLTMGPDGFLYYTDHYAHNVYRVNVMTGEKKLVNKTQVMRANGLAFYKGDLYVLSYTMGKIIKIKLMDGAETSREDFATGFPTSADGIAFDSNGRPWVGAGGALWRANADGKNAMRIAGGGGTNVEFGAGPLNCRDIYVGGGQILRYEMNDVAGEPVPWH